MIQKNIYWNDMLTYMIKTVYISKSRYYKTYPVNQVLFATTLFRNLPQIYCFAANKICDQGVEYNFENNQRCEDWFVVSNIRNEVAFANLVKNSSLRINVGLLLTRLYIHLQDNCYQKCQKY